MDVPGSGTYFETISFGNHFAEATGIALVNISAGQVLRISAGEVLTSSFRYPADVDAIGLTIIRIS